MFSSNTQLFTPEYRQAIADECARVREDFKAEMARFEGSTMVFGMRFHSGDHCVHAFVMLVEQRSGWPKNEYEGKTWANITEELISIGSDFFRHRCWNALKAAAACDYHYEHVKEWD